MPTWWQDQCEVPMKLRAKRQHVPILLAAGSRFDQAHERRTHAALMALHVVDREQTLRPQFNTTLKDLRRGRLQQGERLSGATFGLGAEYWTPHAIPDRKVIKRVVAKARWQVLPKPKKASIWDPRAAASDSKSRLDTQQCVTAMLEMDWHWALRHGLGDYISSVDENGTEVEVSAVKATLMEHAWLVYSAFDYLASIGGAPVTAIALNGYSVFVKEGKLADAGSSQCKKAHLDQLFVLINAQRDRGPEYAQEKVPEPVVEVLAEDEGDDEEPAPAPATLSFLKAAPAQPKVLGLGALGGIGAAKPANSVLAALAGGGSGATSWGKVKLVAKMGALSETKRAKVSARSQGAKLAEQHVGVAERGAFQKAAAKKEGTGGSGGGSTLTLCRHEWLQALVRIAVIRYVLPGTRTVKRYAGVSEAIRHLLFDDLVPNLPTAVGQRSNDFRAAHLYTFDVQTLFERHEASLRAIFTCFAADPINDSASGSMTAKDDKDAVRLSLEEWLEFARAFSLLDKDVSIKEMTLAFMWSRMWVVDETTKASQRRLAGLAFEDFLEALMRCARMKAWPSPLSVREAGFPPEGTSEYIRSLPSIAMDTLCIERGVRWDETPYYTDVECARMCIELCVHDVKCVRPGASQTDGKVSLAHVRGFRKYIFGPDAPTRRG